MSEVSAAATEVRRARQRDPAVPVVEVFGPTIQGEGPLAGVACHFVRLAGCDYRCSWCDSPHAVLPKLWRGTPKKHAKEIVAELLELDAHPGWVTISGGNPAMYHLDALVDELHAAEYLVSVETQGSIWRPWLQFVDGLVISPKPPSSGMASEKHIAEYQRFTESCVRTAAHWAFTACKIVVFNRDDYDWARVTFMYARQRGWQLYLSVGSPVQGGELELLEAARPPREIGEVLFDLHAGYRQVCDWVKSDPAMRDVCVLPQLHTLAWGDAVGV